MSSTTKSLPTPSRSTSRSYHLGGSSIYWASPACSRWASSGFLRFSDTSSIHGGSGRSDHMGSVIHMKRYATLIFLILMVAFCTAPVMGVNQYLGGSPQMTAYISGVNEFSPGQNVNITVVIQNSGTNTMLFTSHDTLSQ